MYTSGADNASYVTPDCEKAGGVRRDSPLGPVCCAKGGCAPQEADLDAIGAMRLLALMSALIDFIGRVAVIAL